MIEQQGFYEFTIANEDVAMEAVKVSRNNIMWLIVSIQLSYYSQYYSVSCDLQPIGSLEMCHMPVY